MPSVPAPSSSAAAVQALASLASVWRATEIAPVKAWTSGHAALDALLPGNGWPVGALSEVLLQGAGIGELSLILPVLRQLSAQQRRIVFIQPPYVPYAPALVRGGVCLQQVCWIHASSDAEARWAAEQTLRAGAAGAVLLWNATTDDRSLRRLQLAAEAGGALAFLYRSLAALHQPSPAALRLALQPEPAVLRVQVVKARGGRMGLATLPLAWPGTWNVA
jgi:cell division inhibitor SulA